MNINFVSNADDLTKERMDVVHKYDEFCFDSGKNYFVFKKTSEKEIENYTKIRILMRVCFLMFLVFPL